MRALYNSVDEISPSVDSNKNAASVPGPKFNPIGDITQSYLC